MKITINGTVPTDVLPNLLDRGLAHLLGPEHTPPHLALGNVVLQFDLVEAANPKDVQIFDHSRASYEPSLVMDVQAVEPPADEDEESTAASTEGAPVELVDFPPSKFGDPPVPESVSLQGQKAYVAYFSQYDKWRVKTICERLGITMEQFVKEGLDLALAKRGLKPLGTIPEAAKAAMMERELLARVAEGTRR